MKNDFVGSTFDDFLEEEEIKEEVTNGAIKKIIALQMQETLKKEKLTKTELAQRLETSRAAVDRLLDPYNDSITLLTLKKAASIMGRKIKLELI
jgi:DNA-binding Xre family transcriptional regulator